MKNNMALDDLLKEPTLRPSNSNLLKLLGEESDAALMEVSEERIKPLLDDLRNHIAFYRMYPDLLIDFMVGPDDTKGKFRFYFYQRVFVRIVMRHRIVFATYPRAYSKSFLTMMVMMLRAVLYPGSNLFVTTGGKEQAASITVAKIEEICKLIPSLNNELDRDRGQTKNSKDNVNYVFKNGSQINVLAARESSRGQRRTGRENFFLLCGRFS